MTVPPSDPLLAIERVVASVADPADEPQVLAAVRAVSPALVDDVVFGAASSTAGSTADGELLAVGIAASPGVGVGVVATSAGAALDLFESGRDVVLVVGETGPADEAAMRVAAAIVTNRGGVASHAAIIARQWGVPAVCGTGSIDVAAGDELLVDGSTGEVRRLGGEPLPESTEHRGPLRQLPDAVRTLLDWADRVASPKLTVLANADLAADAQLALDLGARGVGLCRTEHQFLGDRADLMRRVLDGDAGATSDLVALQRADLVALLEVVSPSPVVVRLLDAPFHEFGSDGRREQNPMLGLRGVRFALRYPGVVEAQAEAIAHAVADVAEAGGSPSVSVLVPMVSLAEELRWAKDLLGDVWFRIGVERGRELAIPVGTMIETPRAALVASSLAAVCDFFSFGTNDLTQFTWGASRDDVDAEMLSLYRQRGLVDRNPFETLDGSGVVRLMALATETGRSRNPDLTAGMCGEHGGDPASIAVAVQLGLTSVSVSPYRVPAARLAAAHAVAGPGHPSGGR